MDKKGKSHQEELFYEVEDILDRKKSKGRFLYKIKWKGYPISDCTWEPMSHLQYMKDMVQKFNAKLDSAKNGTNSLLNKENENSDNKNNGKKRILQRKRLITDDDEFDKNEMNPPEEEKLNENTEKSSIEKKEPRKNLPMNSQRRKLRSSETKKDELMYQNELINRIERPKEKNKNKNRNSARNKGKLIRKSLSRPRTRSRIEKKLEEKKEEKKEENYFEKNIEKKEEKKEEEKVIESFDDLNKKRFFIDENYKQVLGIKMENQQLIAVVEKKNNDIISTELLNTKELKTLNPWILIDYYENRINFE